MTISEAVALCDALKPNQYSAEMKINWLSVLDTQIYKEVFRTHENCLPTEFNGYNGETPPNAPLLVPFPYDSELYSFFLQSAVDRENGESAKFNQSITLFNNAFGRFQNFYNRTHTPLELGVFKV